MKVPVQLIEWGMRRPNTLKTLLYCKKYSDGYIKSENFALWAEKIGIHIKTFKRHIAELQKLKWADLHNGVLYLRSMEAIRRIEGFIFNGKYYIAEKHFNDIKSWIFNRIVHRFSKYVQKRGGDRFIQRETGSKTLYVSLPVRYLANCLGVNKNIVQRFKDHSISAGSVGRLTNHVSVSDTEAFLIKSTKEIPHRYKKGFLKYKDGYFIDSGDYLSSL